MTRAQIYGRAALFAFGVALLIAVLGGSGANAASGRLGGDFPAFYAAGTIVGDGDFDTLYSSDTQASAQAELFPDSSGSFLYFAYPPYVAALYRPLAALDYRLAYTLHTVAMVAAVIGALALLRPILPVLDRRFETAVTLTLLFYPMMRAVTGGQNTAITLLLVAGAWRALHDENEVAAGLTVGLLLYKPQFALPLIGLMVVARRWGAAAAAGVAGVALWGVGALAMGVDWLPGWWSEVSDFASLDADVNGQNAVSWLGFAEGLFGAGSTAARVIAAPLMVATAAALVVLWFGRRTDLAVTMGLTVLGVVMLSPHAMFYDAGVLVLVGLVVADRIGPRATTVLGAAWVLSWLQFVASPLGFAPLFFIIVPAGAWCVKALTASAETRSAPTLVAP